MLGEKRSLDEMTRVTVTSFAPGERAGPKEVLYDVDVPASQAARGVLAWLATTQLDPSGDMATMVRENALPAKRPPVHGDGHGARVHGSAGPGHLGWCGAPA